MKLNDLMQQRNQSRVAGRRYTAIDMALIKHDAAVMNSRVRRGEVKHTNNQYIVVCGCGAE